MTDNIVCFEVSHGLRKELPPFQRQGFGFIVAHHPMEATLMTMLVQHMVDAQFRYYHVFGTYCDWWKDEIARQSAGQKQEIQTSKVALDVLAQELALRASQDASSICYLIGDDYAFLEMIAEDVCCILYAGALFHPTDWQRFKDGFEFIHEGKDGIISVSDRVELGYLNETQVFDTKFKACSAKIFGDKSFYEIWQDLTGQDQ